MSRKQTEGISYFSLDVDFFSSKRICAIRARYGADGIMVYLYILCKIYEKGYYVEVDDDFLFDISDKLHIKTDTVEQVLTFLLSRSMFNEQLAKSDAILTCHDIQERWQKAVKTKAAKTPITVGKYWLLSKEETLPFIKCTLFSYSSEKKEDNSENYSDNSEKKAHKLKEIKENNNTQHNTTPRARTREDNEIDMSKLDDFCGRFNVTNDVANTSLLASVDWVRLTRAFDCSVKFLQIAPEARSLDWLMHRYAAILNGKYDDKANRPTQSESPRKSFAQAERERNRQIMRNLVARFEEEEDETDKPI